MLLDIRYTIILAESIFFIRNMHSVFPCIVGQQKRVGLLFLLVHRHGAVVIQSLCHQLQGQRVLLPACLLDLGPFVLEPDLDLRLVQTQFSRQFCSTSFRQVTILCELVFQACQLFATKRCPWSFLFWFFFLSSLVGEISDLQRKKQL